MKPAHSILDKSFRYVPAASTSVAETWRRFGWQPAPKEKTRAYASRDAAFSPRSAGTLAAVVMVLALAGRDTAGIATLLEGLLR